MKRIGLLSDTHGYLDSKVFHHFKDCDEIWHAGDFGSLDLSYELSNFKLLKGVSGNIDGSEIRGIHPVEHNFNMEGFKIFMIHIGGYPSHYPKEVKSKIKDYMPNIFICGHSHILKVMKDPLYNNMLALNPGAAGKHGFHKIRTLMKLDLNRGKIENMQVIELGKRA